MKKTTKILVLMVSVVLLFALSAVAAFAVESEETESYYQDIKVITNATFDSVASDFMFDGDTTYGSFAFDGVSFIYQKYLENPPRGGKIKASVTLDGNKSVGYFGSLQKSSNAPYINITLGKSPIAGNKETSLKSYAYFVLDWDMCSPTGNYDKDGNLSFGYYFRMQDKTNTPVQLSKAFSSITTDKNGNTKLGSTVLGKSTDWQHYTTILEVVKTYDAAGNLLYQVNGYLYVDGVVRQTILNMVDTRKSFYDNYYAVEGSDPDTSLINLTELRINLPAGSANKTGDDSLLIDNVYVRSFTKYYSGAQEIGDVVSGKKSLTQWSDSVFVENYDYPFGDLVATVNAADGSVGYYDNAVEAFNSISDGAVVELSQPVSDVVIESPIIVKTNGNDFGFSSSSYSAEEIEEGVYKFSRSQNSTIKIYWDMPVGKDGFVCSDNRESNDLFNIATSVIGSVPAYPNDLSDYAIEIKDENDEVVDLYKLVGWAYNPDDAEAGKADTLRPITIFDIESAKGSWIALYPVFEKMDLRVIEEVLDPSGVPVKKITFYKYGDIGTAISKAEKGATIQLRNDIFTENAVAVQKDLSLDLNGHSYAVNLVKGTNTWSHKEGKVVGYASKPAAFNLLEGNSFKISSSLPGGKIFVSAYVVNIDDETGEEKGYNISGSSAVYFNGSGKAPVDLTIDGENLAVYASSVVESYSQNIYGKVTVNGGEYYRTVNDFQGLFNNRHNNCVSYEINDATLAAITSGSVFSNGNSTATTEAYSVVFNNCHLYGKNNVNIINSRDPNCHIYLNNCIADGAVTLSDGTITLGEGTVYNATAFSKAGVAEGCSAFAKPSDVEFNIQPNSFTKTDGVGLNASSYEIPEPTTINASFDTMVAGPNNSVVIEWYGLDGNIVSSSVAFAGYVATPPTGIVTPWENGDGWRDFVITNWSHDGEPVTDFTIPAGFSGTYRFDAIAPTPETEGQLFAANPTKLLWNISFGTGIEIKFYIPVEEAVTLDSITVDGKALPVSADTVKIGDLDYKVATFTTVSLNTHLYYAPTINYTIDGVAYSFEFGEVSALDYLRNVMSNTEISETQKTLLINMVRYISELCKLAYGFVPAEYSEFLAEYPAPEYPDSYDDKGYNEEYYEEDSRGKPVSDYATLAQQYLDRIEIKVEDGDVSIWIYPAKTDVALAGTYSITELEIEENNEVVNVEKRGEADGFATVITRIDIKTLVTADYLEIKFKNTDKRIRTNAYYSFAALINSYKAAGKDSGLLESIYALANAMIASEGEESILPTYPLLAPANKDEE